jgi:putative addiction module component (TIGR02574 family)
MIPEIQAVFDAALALPVPERQRLVERLLESLPPDPGTEELTDEDLLAELDRRSAEYDHDPSVGIPWSEVKRQP